VSIYPARCIHLSRSLKARCLPVSRQAVQADDERVMSQFDFLVRLKESIH